jgi:hypothetical protein
MDSFPAMIRHRDSLVPVLLATLGMLGIIYFIILVFIGLIMTFIFAMLGKVVIKRDLREENRKHREMWRDNNINNTKTNIYNLKFIKILLKKTLHKTIKTSTPIIKTMVIASLITAFLIEIGVFDYITDYVKNHIEFLPFSTEELTISITSMINSIAAYTMAGALLDKNAINEMQAIRALLFGSVLSSITIIRFLIPYYIGLYGLKDGINLMAISTVMRALISILFIIIISIISLIINF